MAEKPARKAKPPANTKPAPQSNNLTVPAELIDERGPEHLDYLGRVAQTLDALARKIATLAQTRESLEAWWVQCQRALSVLLFDERWQAALARLDAAVAERLERDAASVRQTLTTTAPRKINGASCADIAARMIAISEWLRPRIKVWRQRPAGAAELPPATTGSSTNAADRQAAVAIDTVAEQGPNILARHLEALQAMLDLGAVDATSRRRTEEISKKAWGDSDYSLRKQTVAKLVLWGMADSQTGRSGGAWITGIGKRQLRQSTKGKR